MFSSIEADASALKTNSDCLRYQGGCFCNKDDSRCFLRLTQMLLLGRQIQIASAIKEDASAIKTTANVFFD